MLSYNWHRAIGTHLSVQLGKLHVHTHPGKHAHTHDSVHRLHLCGFCAPFANPFPSPSLPPFPSQRDLFSLTSMGLNVLASSLAVNIVCTRFCLPSFTQRNYFEIALCCCVRQQSLFFYCCIVFHAMSRPQFIITCGWALGFFFFSSQLEAITVINWILLRCETCALQMTWLTENENTSHRLGQDICKAQNW